MSGKLFEGTVLKVNVMGRCASVFVSEKVRHPIYGKFVKRSRKVLAHFDGEAPSIGQNVVLLSGVSPFSKKKRCVICALS